MSERTLDHVGIAVTSLDDAIPLWEGLLSTSVTGREIVTSQDVEVAFLAADEASVELLAPLRPNSPVAQFLERRGPGIHHLAFRVPNLEAALESLREEGFALIDETPRQGAHGRRIAFVHPRSLNGVLVELVEASS
jgi:methylmalonyl-CoA epimerase